MLQATLTVPSAVADDDLTARLRVDADFDARWAAWQSKGRSRDRAFHRKLFVLVPAAAVVTAIVSFLLIR
jgi:hypothetical protein